MENTYCERSKLPLMVEPAVADPEFPRGGGANSPGGAPTYDFAKFSQKLHEIERIWAPRGARASLVPPLRSATGQVRCLASGTAPQRTAQQPKYCIGNIFSWHMLLGMCHMKCVTEYHEPHVSKTTMRPSHRSCATTRAVVEYVGVTDCPLYVRRHFEGWNKNYDGIIIRNYR